MKFHKLIIDAILNQLIRGQSNENIIFNLRKAGINRKDIPNNIKIYKCTDFSILLKYIRQLKIHKLHRLRFRNNFKRDGRKKCLVNNTISKFIDIMTTKNGFLTGQDLSNMISKIFHVKISGRTIQDHRYKKLGIKKLN